MSLAARVKEEPGCAVTDRAYIKAEADWSDWAVHVKLEQADDAADRPAKAEAPCTPTCAGDCRRGALLDHTYATPYCPPADVCAKTEPPGEREWAALYAGHAVKDELVLGPERVQRPRVPALSRAVPEGALAAGAEPAEEPRRGQLALKKCCVRLERAPHCGLRARARGSDRDTPATGDSDSEDEIYTTVDYERDPICDLCGWRFALKSDLMNHVAVHIHDEGGADDDYESDDLPRYLWRWAHLAPRDCRVRLERCSPARPPAPALPPPPPPPPAHRLGAAPRRARAHSPPAANTYMCDICGGTFTTKSNLIRHIYTLHMKRCNSPNISKMIHKRNYAAHRSYTCECKKEFKILKHLQIHIRTRTGGKLYSCATCKIRFPSRVDFERHTLVHTGQKPFSCEICKRKFRQEGNLKKHKACVHNVGYVGTSLKIHKLIHVGEKPYSCEVCEKKFTRSSTLYAHRRIHTGEKPYSCEVCEKKFTQSGNLHAHRLIHTGEKPYPCKMCNKRFRKASDLYRHERIHTRTPENFWEAI